MRGRTPAIWEHVGLAVTGSGMVVAAQLSGDGWSPTAPAALFALLGWLILRSRPGHAIGRLYLGLGVGLVAFAVMNSMEGVVAADDAVVQPVLWVTSWAWAVLLLLPVTWGVLLLPDGHLPSRRWRWVVWTLAAACACLVFSLPYDDNAPAALNLPAPPRLVSDLALAVGGILAALVLVASVASPFVRYRGASADERSALRLIALLTVSSVGIYLGGTSVSAWSGDLVAAVALAVVPIGVTVAIVRHRMLDIDRLVSRALAYLVVTAILVAVYVSIVLVPTSILGTADVPDLVVAVATLSAAALFRPLRVRVQRMVDRRFNRGRYDAVAVLERFTGRMRDQLNQESIVADVRAVAGQTVAPNTSSVLLIGGR